MYGYCGCSDVNETPANRRLDSWKEIADYLGRDVRTVIRWEKEKALPIRRIPGGKRQGVYAFSQEIDEWMRGEFGAETRPVAGEEPREAPDEVISELPTAPPSIAGRRFPSHGLRRVLGMATGIVLLVGVAFLLSNRSRSVAASPPPLIRPLQFARMDYYAGMPRSLVAGDFNGDGRLDLAFTDSLHGAVVVLLGDGHGAFSSRVHSPTVLKFPEHMDIGDFDGDGRLDAVITSFIGGHEIEVLLGNGDGSFRERARYDVAGRSRWVATGDLNGDGKLDLVISGSVASKIFVKFGRGDGTFLDSGSYDAEPDVAALALVDLSGKKTPDIVTADYRQAMGNTISVYRNQGDGTFAGRQIFPVCNGPLGLAVADLNRDGRPDLITANYPKTGCVLLGTGPGMFSEPISFDAGNGNGYVAAMDLDRDGAQDLIVLGEHSATASILLGDGKGGLVAAEDLTTGDYPDGLVAADFDGDRKLDLAILNIHGNSISVFLNRTEAVASRRWFTRAGAIRAD